MHVSRPVDVLDGGRRQRRPRLPGFWHKQRGRFGPDWRASVQLEKREATDDWLGRGPKVRRHLQPGDSAGLGAFYAEDVVLEDPLSPEPIQGRETVLATAAAFRRAFPDMVWTLIRDPVIASGAIAWEVHAAGTMTGSMPGPDGDIPATGRPFAVDMGHLLDAGAPESTDDHDQGLRAVRMALEMQKAMGPLNQRWETAGISETLHVRIGVNAGVATVGNFGSAERTKYTALGKQVNVAARIQFQCEPGKVPATHRGYWSATRSPACPKGELVLKGLHKPMPAYEVQA